MSAPEPAALVELPTTPNWIRWGAGDGQLVAAHVGGTNGVVSITVDGSNSRYEPTAIPLDLPGGTVTAVAVAPEHSSLAVAEVMSIPGDDEFRRTRLHDLRSGQQRWFRNYLGADDLQFDLAGRGVLLARRLGQIALRDIDTGNEVPLDHPIDVGAMSHYPWSVGPPGTGGKLVAGSQPALVDLSTGDVVWAAGLPGECDQIVYLGADSVVVRGGGPETWEAVEVGSTIEWQLVVSSWYLSEMDARDLTVRSKVEASSGHSASYDDAAVSPDGKRVALASGHELVMLTLPELTPATGFRPITLGAGTFGRRRRVRFSPDGSILAVNTTRTGSGVMLVDAQTGAGSGQLPADVTDMEFSPSGRLLAVTSGPRISIYDVDAVRSETWAVRNSWDLPGVPSAVAVATITTHPQGASGPYVRKRVGAVGSLADDGGFERFGNVGAPDWDYTPQTGKPVAGLAFNPNGSGDYAVWRMAGPKYLTYYNSANVELLDCPLAIRPGFVGFLDDRQLVAIGADRRARVFDLVPHPGELQAQLVWKTVALDVGLWHGAVAADVSVVAVAGGDRTWLLNAQDGSLIHPDPVVHGGNVNAVAFDPTTPTTLFVAHQRAAVDVVDTATGRIIRQIPHLAPVTRLAVRGDGRLLLTVNRNDVRVIPLPVPATPGGDELSTFDVPVTKVAFHPRDATAVVATDEPSIVMFDLDNRSELWWTPLPAPGHDFAFDIDGDVLAIACDRGVHFFARRGS